MHQYRRTFWWILITLCDCVITIIIMNIPFIPKSSLVFFYSQFPNNSGNHLLLYCKCRLKLYFLACPINGITLYPLFCVRLLWFNIMLDSISHVVCISNLFLLLLSHISLYRYTIKVSVVFSFWLLGIRLLGYSCSLLYMDISFNFSCVNT